MIHTRFTHSIRVGMVICAALSAGLAGGADATRTPADDLWDPQRYIGLDEIQRGMEGYRLTDYGEAGIEKFPVRVVNIVRDYEPGHNLIHVMGLDERFKHTGPVAGSRGLPG